MYVGWSCQYSCDYHSKGVKDSDGSVTGETDDVMSDTVDRSSSPDLDLAIDKKKFSKRGFTTNWGPVGFKKKLHPLSIMVCVIYWCE